MTNKLSMICSVLAGQLVRWMRAIIFSTKVGASSIAWSIRAAGLAWFSAGALPFMRKQLIDPAVELRRQPGEHILEVGKWVVPIELGRLQQAHHDSRALAGQFSADEQPIFTIMLICNYSAPHERMSDNPA